MQMNLNQLKPQQWTIENLPQIIESTKFEEIGSQFKEMIVFLGCTREGKSTLVNFLGRVDLQIRQVEDDVIDVVNLYQGDFCKIGHSYDQSQTIMPKFLKTQYNGQKVILCDCPGYSDSRGMTADIYISYCFSKIFRSIKKLRVVLVTSLSSINSGTADNFINPLNRFANYFINYFDIESFSKALSIIFTKCDKQTHEYFVKRLKNINQKNKKLKNNSKVLLEGCLNQNNIGLFRKPNEQGKIYQQDREKLLEMIFRQKSVTMVDQVRLSLDPRSICDLTGYFKNILKQIYEQLDTNIKQLKEFYTKRLDQIEEIQDNFANLQQQNEKMKSYLKIIKSGELGSLQDLLSLFHKQKIINFNDNLFNSKLGLLIFYSRQNQKHIELPLPKIHNQFIKTLNQIKDQIIQKRIKSCEQRASNYQKRRTIMSYILHEKKDIIDEQIKKQLSEVKREMGRNYGSQISVFSKLYGGFLATLYSFQCRLISLPFAAYSATVGTGDFSNFWQQQLAVEKLYKQFSGIKKLQNGSCIKVMDILNNVKNLLERRKQIIKQIQIMQQKDLLQIYRQYHKSQIQAVNHYTNQQ